uniref:Uncharacterized protein n=1 Tax=Neogobius melanostomus TaxID=47308 RepID=A0A8C6WHQ1_9GOBI
TCQEVVITLAQALGQPGRYTLREKFKDFQRCMAPSEHVLETLERYGELNRDVQLSLILNGPAGSDSTSRRYQPCPPLHRQSLPPLTEQQAEDVRRPKRKSLTIMEEAWEWLENLGKGKVYRTTSKKDLCKKSEKKNPTSLEATLSFCKDSAGQNSKVKIKHDKVVRSDLDNQTSCCIRSQLKARECRSSEAKFKSQQVW